MGGGPQAMCWLAEKGAGPEAHWRVQPDETGLSMARALDALGVPVTMVLDSGAAYIMDRCAHASADAPQCFTRRPRHVTIDLKAVQAGRQVGRQNPINMSIVMDPFIGSMTLRSSSHVPLNH